MKIVYSKDFIKSVKRILNKFKIS